MEPTWYQYVIVLVTGHACSPVESMVDRRFAAQATREAPPQTATSVRRHHQRVLHGGRGKICLVTVTWYHSGREYDARLESDVSIKRGTIFLPRVVK